MPIYEYKCPACHKVFEEWVRSHDTGPQPCPTCGSEAQHIVSQTTFVLKGGGWYVTEYGNRKNNPEGPSAPAATWTEGDGDAASASSAADASADTAGKTATTTSDTSSTATTTAAPASTAATASKGPKEAAA